MPELNVRDLTKRFAGQSALDGVSFTVGDGEFFTLLGPSGCGKSTTLSAIAGLETPDRGSITAGDTVYVDVDTDARARRFLTPEERNLGMVFQSYALWPHMTVAANLGLPLKLRRVPRPDRDARIDSALDQVGLLPYRDRYPHQMSGGQQQRVALARALVYSPTVLLLDEPLSNLDAKLREQARAWLKGLQRQVGITTVYVTHDQAEALTLSDRIAVMREGRMLQVGTPEEIYDRPAVPEVADLVGRCNFLTGTVVTATGAGGGELGVRVDATGSELRLHAGGAHAVGDRVTLGLRAERLSVARPDPAATPASANALPARLARRLYSGSRYEYELDCGGRALVAESANSTGPEGSVGEGDEVWLGVPPDRAHVFSGVPDSAAVATDADADVEGA